jgi:hypothetical protein
MTLKNDSPFKTVTGLGQFQKEYSGGSCGSCFFVGLGLLLTLAGLGLAALATSWFRNGNASRAEAMPLLGTAGVLFLVGVIVLLLSFLGEGRSAALFEHGVALAQGKQVKQAAWGDIASVYVRVVRLKRLFITVATSHWYSVQTRGGDKLEFDDDLGSQVEELGNTIQKGVARAQFPSYWEALQKGERVTFGPLALDQQKLYVNKQELPWAEVRGVKLDKGRVWVEKTGKGWLRWEAVSVPRIPNVLIFYELVARMTEVG